MALGRLVFRVLAPVVCAPASGPGVSAAEYVVDSPFDVADAVPGDGVCATADGQCTLRAAVQETNAEPGLDTITLLAGLHALYIPGEDDDAAVGDLDVTDDLELRGSGADATVIDGAVSTAGSGLPLGDRIFSVHPGAQVQISQITVIHGASVDSSGGGINNLGSLSLAEVVLRDNAAFEGGGIFNTGTLDIRDSVVRDNEAEFGGGMTNAGGSLTVNASRFINNGAPGTDSSGGGIENLGDGIVSLSDVVFRDNGAHFGGAILNAGMARLSRVILDGNTGLLAPGILNGGSMTVEDSTLSRHEGRAILNEGNIALTNTPVSGNAVAMENRSEASLSNSTMSDNVLFGVFNDNQPLPPAAEPPPGLVVTISNTILAGNGGHNCEDTNPGLESTVSGGHNLSSDGTCPFSAAGDMMNTDPLLGPLADNGGPTQTHALLAGSPAIDAGDNAACPAADQRGVERPRDGDQDGSPFAISGRSRLRERWAERRLRRRPVSRLRRQARLRHQFQHLWHPHPLPRYRACCRPLADAAKARARPVVVAFVKSFESAPGAPTLSRLVSADRQPFEEMSARFGRCLRRHLR